MSLQVKPTSVKRLSDDVLATCFNFLRTEEVLKVCTRVCQIWKNVIEKKRGIRPADCLEYFLRMTGKSIPPNFISKYRTQRSFIPLAELDASKNGYFRPRYTQEIQSNQDLFGSLEVVVFPNMDRYVDVSSFLQILKNCSLTELSLPYTTNIQGELEKLAKNGCLTKLKRVNFSKCRLTRLTFLRNSRQLKEMDLSFHYRDNIQQELEELAEDGCFTALEKADFSSCLLTDVSFLEHFLSLRGLRLLDNYIKKGLQDLPENSCLENIVLMSCEINDVSFLKRCPRLRRLDLSRNMGIGAKLQSFADENPNFFENLRFLGLGNCKLKCEEVISFLPRCVNLQVLDLENRGDIVSQKDLENGLLELAQTKPQWFNGLRELFVTSYWNMNVEQWKELLKENRSLQIFVDGSRS